MGKLRITQRKRAWLAVLLAFAIPGMGHVYNEQYSRGLLLLAGLLLDVTAIFRLADSDGGRHLLLIVYLGMLLPVFYFVSVYEALQLKEIPREERMPVRLAHGILLALSGIVMMIMVKPPDMLLPWMNELAELIVGPLLMTLACVVVWTAARRGGFAVFKLGRLTAAILILSVGALLLWDQARGSSDIALLGDWWPLLFLLLGIEVILYSTTLRAKSAKLKFDLSGAAAALVVTVTAYAVTQYADFPVRWLDQFNVDLNGMVDYGDEKGYRIDKNVMKVLVDEDLSSITVKNVNGDVTLRADDVAGIEVYSTVWVDAGDENESKRIAEQSTVDVTPGNETVLEAKGERYGADNNRVPKMNLTVVVPRIEPSVKLSPPDVQQDEQDDQGGIEGDGQTEDAEGALATTSADIEADGSESPSSNTPTASSETVLTLEEQLAALPGDEPSLALPDFEWEMSPPPAAPSAIRVAIENINGDTEVTDLVAEDGLTVKSGDGNIRVARIIGPLAVTGNSGSIEVDTLDGSSTLELKNGEITVNDATGGALYAVTSNGNISLGGVWEDAEAETKNGSITIAEAHGPVKASTMNGGIAVSSSQVGGNWDLDSSVGEIKVVLPELGDYSLYGSVTFGKINAEMPFRQIRKTVRGTVGTGVYRIHINATNSITIESQDTT
ncbi:DUF4097 family beta strand repeat-containing protein [Paenibacillus sp. PAMC21692]|uniref:DUF4097 family beta strand repeat-containing protein n=1 Tax=Paenibacillus sp. PAMC21692 TaxID=2762320 RepID=UPI00164D1F71|nr:DUF4097 family beta strand repeat-containing protein [Paenibacillus sp. PAMC21692]QNK59504.1 DUF4097 family beta strand repeat protein [Paenibacillus sp. PAMC21692]